MAHSVCDPVAPSQAVAPATRLIADAAITLFSAIQAKLDPYRSAATTAGTLHAERRPRGDDRGHAQARAKRRERRDQRRAGHAADPDSTSTYAGERRREAGADLERCRDDVRADEDQEQVGARLRLRVGSNRGDVCGVHAPHSIHLDRVCNEAISYKYTYAEAGDLGYARGRQRDVAEGPRGRGRACAASANCSIRWSRPRGESGAGGPSTFGRRNHRHRSERSAARAAPTRRFGALFEASLEPAVDGQGNAAPEYRIGGTEERAPWLSRRPRSPTRTRSCSTRQAAGKLGPRAAAFFDRCERRDAILYVPTVVIWECSLLARVVAHQPAPDGACVLRRSLQQSGVSAARRHAGADLSGRRAAVQPRSRSTRSSARRRGPSICRSSLATPTFAARAS